MPPKSPTSRMSALSAIVDSNMSGIWDMIKTNKQNELTMLNQEIQYSRQEASTIKNNLIQLGISIPEVEKTSNYTKASNIPVATIGGNINMAERMLKYQQGQVDAYTQALTNYNQGVNLMDEMEGSYRDINSVLEPLADNAPYEKDMLRWSDPDAYREYQLEGGLVYDPEGDAFNYPGSTDTAPSEMQQLVGGLTPELQDKLKNTQFREGFLASKTSEAEAVVSVTDRINTERELLKIRNEMKTATIGDIDRLRALFQNTKNKLGNRMSPSVTLAGQSLQMASLSLQAGDTENWQKIMTAIGEDKALNSIMPEVSALINGTLSASEEDPYAAYIGVVSGAYQEYVDLISIGDKWEEQFGYAQAQQYLISAKKKGSRADVPEAFKKEAGEIYNLYNRHQAFNYSGILSDDAAALQSIVMLDSMDKQLTDTEIQFLGMRGRDDIENYYAKGPFGGQLEDFEERIQGVYDPNNPDFDKEAYEIQQAHIEWMQLHSTADDDENDIEAELTVIQDMNMNSQTRVDLENSASRNKASLKDFFLAWEETIPGGSIESHYGYSNLRGAKGPDGEHHVYNTVKALMNDMPSNKTKMAELFPGRESALTRGFPDLPFRDHNDLLITYGMEDSGNALDGTMFLNDTDILMADIQYMDYAVGNQMIALLSDQRKGPDPSRSWLYNTVGASGSDYVWTEMSGEEKLEKTRVANSLYAAYHYWRKNVLSMHKNYHDALTSGAYEDAGGMPHTYSNINYTFDPVLYEQLSAHVAGDPNNPDFLSLSAEQVRNRIRHLTGK